MRPDLEDRLTLLAVISLPARGPYRTQHPRVGRPNTTTRSAALVSAFEAWKLETGKSRTGEFARFVHARLGVAAGASPDAIQRHLNRALKAGHKLPG